MKKFLRSVDTPILLLVVGTLAYGIQALWLGYYLDDWVFLYHMYRGGYEQLAEYSFGVNRPFGAWPWWLGYNLLGYSPLKWQLWSLAWRLITCILLWLGWKQIFPKRTLEVSLASVLFLVYPIFLQQTAAVTFSDHWISFALYALSVLLMALSLKHWRLYYPLTGLALAASGLQLFTIEYFIGLELIRPLLLWFLFRDLPRIKMRLWNVVRYEIPYAVVLGVFLAWRFLFMPTPGFDRNTPELLFDFLKNPLRTISSFSITVVQDVVEGVLGTWYKTYHPATISLAPVSNLISWGVAAAVFAVAFIFFYRRAKRAAEPGSERGKELEWLIAGFVIMIAGFLPAWVIGHQLVSTENYADRYGLAAMFGASLFIVGLASYFLKQNHKIALICVLIALGAGYQFRLSNEFRWGWEKQSRLAWQLAWRIPGLKPDTSIYGDGTLSSGSWADISWLNFLYGSPSARTTEDYWYFDLNKFTSGAVPAREQAVSEKRFEHLFYQGNTSDSLVIQFKTVPNQCLWVLTGEDLGNPYLNPIVKQALPLSTLTRITSTAQTNPNLRAVFLAEPVHEWCYFYQKAQLALQERQWSEVQTLWQRLSQAGLKTGVAVEYLPFVVGTAHAGDFETALAISTRAKSIDLLMHDPLCQTWKKVFDDPALPEVPAAVKQEVVDQLECQYLIK